jgi:putative transposase
MRDAMSRPRQVLPETFYLITRRCTQRQFLMRPDEKTTNAFIYCLAVAATRYEIDVLLTVAESNHHHSVIFDRKGRCSEFVEYFHKVFARCQNSLRGRWENFWAAEEPCITRLLDPATVIDKLVYTASNPVKDRLVERVHHWPGANAYPSFLSGREMSASRPAHFFRPTGPMPATATLRLVIPPELGDRNSVLEAVRAGVNAVEEAARQERQQTGARVVGRKAILSQSWRAAPTSVEPRRNRRPRFAGAMHVRVLALSAYRTFLFAYKLARKRWLAGEDALFPAGTYWLARFANVQLEHV